MAESNNLINSSSVGETRSSISDAISSTSSVHRLCQPVLNSMNVNSRGITREAEPVRDSSLITDVVSRDNDFPGNGQLQNNSSVREHLNNTIENNSVLFHQRSLASRSHSSGHIDLNRNRLRHNFDSAEHIRRELSNQDGASNNSFTRQSNNLNAQSGKQDNQADSTDLASDEKATLKEQSSKTAGSEKPECPICLQFCVQPVRLPCNHVFCFLCVKGIALQNGRCALCRTGIPREYLSDPDVLVFEEESCKTTDEQSKSHYQWFYEGTAGWWQYEERNAIELEEKYQSGPKLFEMVIVGLVFVVDLNQMVQYRRSDPNKRRRIKRDSANSSKKGVAGLKVRRCIERSSGDGGEAAISAGVPPRNPLLQPMNNAVRNNMHRSSPSLMTASYGGPSSALGRRMRNLRRNGSDSDSASDDTEFQVLEGMSRRSLQRTAPVGDEGNNSSSARMLVGAPTMYVHSIASASVAANDHNHRDSAVDSAAQHIAVTSRGPVAAHDTRVIDGQESPIYYSGMTTPSNTPRSVASGTGSPTERYLPAHSVHFEALIDGITGLVSSDVNSDERLAQAQ